MEKEELIQKEEFSIKVKRYLINPSLKIILSFFIIGVIYLSFIIIPHENPPTEIIKYRDLARPIVTYLDNYFFIDSEKINSEANFLYTNSTAQEIKIYDNIRVSTTGEFEGRKTPAHQGIWEDIQ